MKRKKRKKIIKNTLNTKENKVEYQMNDEVS